MATDPMMRVPSLPRADGEDAQSDTDETDEDTRETVPGAVGRTAGLPFRSARRDTPTMVSPHQPTRAQTVNLAHPPAPLNALPFKSAVPAGATDPVRTASLDAPRRIPTPPATPVAIPPVPFKVAEAAPPSKPPATGMSALPFHAAGARPDTCARLSLEQFALLAAELAVWPAAAAQIRTRYGLDEAAHREEHAIWQYRFSNDRELFAGYAALFQHYRQWLERQRT